MGEDRDLSGSDLSSEQGGVFAHPLPPDLWVTNGEKQKKKQNSQAAVDQRLSFCHPGLSRINLCASLRENIQTPHRKAEFRA